MIKEIKNSLKAFSIQQPEQVNKGCFKINDFIKFAKQTNVFD